MPENLMTEAKDQDRRSFLKSVGYAGAAAAGAALAEPNKAAAQSIKTAAGLGELNRLDAGELAMRIARRDISPVEVIDAALARLAETEPALNAFTAVDTDGARRAALAAEAAVTRGDALGPLHGVPVSVKDLIDVADLPASYGSLIMKDHVARADAPSVERLRRAGAIILGKTATSEFGYQGITKSLIHGTTRNPWNLALTPGGSSGGAAASVAAGVTPIALGSDGGGSIRGPCSLTGLVGIKANFGRVPVWPPSAVTMLAHVGPIARSVADAALLLGVVAGPDRRDPFSLLQSMEREPDARELRALKVGYSPTLGFPKIDPPVESVVSAAVDRLRAMFPTLETVAEVCPDPFDFHRAIFLGGISARLGDLITTSPQLIDPPLVAFVKQFREMSADTYTRLLRSQLKFRETLRAFFERYDLLLTPTMPCVAWDVDRSTPPGHENFLYFNRPFNHSGQPAASLPCGLTADKLPVGLQVVAPLGQDARLIAALRVIEAALDVPLTPVEIESGGRRI
jgi:aspartyl-tRNA(Asn)/glutamyl-tRNA(Gln) amidotransferase subunit A